MAIWYAQLASTDVSAANQWNAAPDGSGAWLTWENLQPTDVLCANGKTVIINGSFECAAITTLGNYGGGTGANGGGFYVQTGAKTFTLTTDIVAGTTTCLITYHSSGTVAVIGDVTGGGYQYAYGIHKYTGAGTLTVEGAITGGTATSGTGRDCYGLFHSSAGGATVVTGSATGGTAQSSHGIYVNGAGATVTLNGNATGNAGGTSLSAGVYNGAATAVVTVNGNAVAGTGVAAPGVFAANGCTVTVVGSLVDSATCGAAYGKLYWQPASVAHYWQVAVDGSNNQRYTLPPQHKDVRNAVNYGYYGESLEAGQLVLPATSDVKLNVQYGDDGTEFTGTLVAGGGGVPLIGPGGLVG